MYKTRLQELCQQRRWAPPEYATSRDGPDHKPRFRATVSVCGASFDSPAPVTSAKEAQNLAAQAAIEHFAPAAPPPASPAPAPAPASASAPPVPQGECSNMYKTRLQELCHKWQWRLPEYVTVRYGPDHNPRFRSTISVGGASFDSPTAAISAKEAQNLAAQAAIEHFAPSAPPPPSPALASSPSVLPGECSGMYKMRLQELCHQRQWRPPEYAITRDGPDHNPRFCATVSVGCASFASPTPATSTKEAQNLAARAALDHFASAAPPPLSLTRASATLPPPSPTPASVTPIPPKNQMMSKSQLLLYLQRKNLDPPVYDCVREGASHNPRFKATVRVGDQIFESLQYFNTLKEAEHDAARVALTSLPLEETTEVQVEAGFYKKLLQELAQKEQFSLPKYTTFIGGMCHMPTFSSTVEVEGETFQGDSAKTKKQAEMNAAKVAFYQLKERGQNRIALSCEVQESPLPTSSRSTAKVMNVQQERALSLPKAWIKIEEGIKDLALAEEQEDGSSKRIMDDNNSVSIDLGRVLPSGRTDSPREVADNSNQSVLLPKKLDSEIATNKQDPVRNVLSEDRTSSPSAPPNLSSQPVTFLQNDFSQDGGPLAAVKELVIDTLSGNSISSASAPSGSSDCITASMNTDPSKGRTTCSLLCNRVQVYPRKPDLVLPEGATVLPISDDMWVAVSLDFSHQEGGVLV